jgi:hypothetical protein
MNFVKDIRWAVGQTWVTSRGHLWEVVEITVAGQPVLWDGKRRAYQNAVPKKWKRVK